MSGGIPNDPVTDVPATSSPNGDLAGVGTFPSLARINVTDKVGPRAANRQVAALEQRDETLRVGLNKVIDNSNQVDNDYLRRDGSTQKDSTAGMLDDLPMNDNKVVGMGAGTVGAASKDATNGDQLYTEQQARIGGDATNAAAIALKANIASPALTGAPTSTTPSPGDNSTKIATTAFVTTALTAVPAGSVHQAGLNTSQGAVSLGPFSVIGAPMSGAAAATLPGGEYGFYPQTKRTRSGALTVEDMLLSSFGGATSYATQFGVSYASSSSASITFFAQQRYVNASPPYDLGDGEVPLFVFVLRDKDDKIIGTYVAQDPPWAHNGPTKVAPDFYRVVNGKQVGYQNQLQLPDGYAQLSLPERMAARRAAKSVAVVVDQTIKNADMGLLPHPFINPPDGSRVVLLDACSTLDLLDLHNTGESIAELLNAGAIQLGKTVKRCGPRGVEARAWSWR